MASSITFFRYSSRCLNNRCMGTFPYTAPLAPVIVFSGAPPVFFPLLPSSVGLCCFCSLCSCWSVAVVLTICRWCSPDPLPVALTLCGCAPSGLFLLFCSTFTGGGSTPHGATSGKASKLAPSRSTVLRSRPPCRTRTAAGQASRSQTPAPTPRSTRPPAAGAPGSSWGLFQW